MGGVQASKSQIKGNRKLQVNNKQNSRRHSNKQHESQIQHHQPPIFYENVQIRPYNLLFPLQKQPNSIKNKTHQAVKNNNVNELKKLVNYFRVDPHEELSVKGYNWCSLHYAAHFKVPEIIEFLIQISYLCYQQEFMQLINIRTKSGHSPAMLCVIYKSVGCLKLLLEYGGIDLKLRDIKNRTIIQIAEQHKSDQCLALLQMYANKADKDGIIPINQQKCIRIPGLDELLNRNQEENQELQRASIPSIDIEKYHDLLLYGDRIPCVICLSDEGYLKYTTCCGQPIHSLCKSVKIVKCPYCGKKSFGLTAEIYFPERAFELPQDKQVEDP